MLGKLFLLFTVVPLVDLYLLITLGGVLGGGPTLALVITTGLLGATLARREGLRVWRDWQQAVAQGQMPREGVTSSLLVLIGGVLLVTPGLITDAVGLTLLIPPARRSIAALLAGYVRKRFEIHTVGPGLGPLGASPEAAARGDIIDVDATESSSP